MSELSRRTGVPVPTLKYYLREGLLPAGERTSATQASYDETHVARVRLVRALTGSAGLSAATARRVVAEIDDPAVDPLVLLGRTHAALEPPGAPVDLDAARELVAGLGWVCEEGPDGSAPSLVALARALAAVDEVGFEVPPGHQRRYADSMAEVAQLDIDHIPTGSRAEAVRYSVLGTVVMEPVLLALRRLAQADAAVRRFGVAGGGAG